MNEDYKKIVSKLEREYEKVCDKLEQLNQEAFDLENNIAYYQMRIMKNE